MGSYVRGGLILAVVTALSVCLSQEGVCVYAKKTYGWNYSEQQTPTPSPPDPMVGQMPPTPTSLPPDFPFPEEFGMECRVERGFIREGSTFNDPSETITGSPEECCVICGMDPKCVVWTRNRSNGACSLKFRFVELTQNDDFDSGVVGGAPAAQGVPPDVACVVESDVDFTGNVFLETSTDTVDECCRMCENNAECFAWSRDRSTNACLLKNSFDGRVSTSNLDGGTIF